MVFDIFSPPKIGEKLAFFTQKITKFCKNGIITLAKLAENSDHSIDPWLGGPNRKILTCLRAKRLPRVKH
jgi:hypothetical protein